MANSDLALLKVWSMVCMWDPYVLFDWILARTHFDGEKLIQIRRSIDDLSLLGSKNYFAG